MKTLYFECNMGAAGDMLTASLLELSKDKRAFVDKMNALGIPGVRLSAGPCLKCGITGTRVIVTVDGQEEESLDENVHEHHHAHDDHDDGDMNEHHHDHDGEDIHEHHHDHDDDARHIHTHRHSGMHEIEHIVSHLDISDKVRGDVLAVYGLIAAAESHAHGVPVEQIHFHEVGTMDAIADIVGVCLLMEELAPERVMASPVHVGSGQVRCAHGILPVPAPATAYILKGVPVYGGRIRGELCTTTGAALLKHFVSGFGEMPVMKIAGIGYGMGKKDFEAANCVRAYLGEVKEGGDKIAELCCNLDDMTPEAIGFAQERLFEGGALDVYTTAAGMKKNRPGILLACMCREGDKERMIRFIFKYTTTLGIREYSCNRYTLSRSERSVQTGYGAVRVKEASGWGTKREKAEYEDLARIAKDADMSLAEISKILSESGDK